MIIGNEGRMVESEDGAFSLGKNFFKLDEKLNKSIRSKDTIFCLSENGDCVKKC